MESLKFFKFRRKLDNGELTELPEPKFAIKHGDKIWLGEEEPTDPTIQFWIISTENVVKTVYKSKTPPTDTSVIWLEV